METETAQELMEFQSAMQERWQIVAPPLKDHSAVPIVVGHFQQEVNWTAMPGPTRGEVFSCSKCNKSLKPPSNGCNVT